MVYFNTYFCFKNYITKNIILINYNMKINQGILYRKKKEKIKKEGFDLMSQVDDYDNNTDELLKDYSEAINRIDVKNPLKNKNIKIELNANDSDPFTEFGYVNNVGVLRPYMENVDYRSTTWGKNGCPTNLSTTNVPKTNVKLNKNNLFEIETSPKLINMIFPMIPGQACGYEGENIYVDSIGDLNDYSTEYKGAFTSTIPNVDNGSNLYNFDLCKTRAIDEGMRYFGLNNYNKSLTNSQCVVSNDISNFQQSILSGNIVYSSSSVSSAIIGEIPLLLIHIFGSEFRIYKVVNNWWSEPIILASYNTEKTDECYNNGTFNIDEVEATWGGNCNSEGYNVQPDNILNYIHDIYRDQTNNLLKLPNTSLSYQIGTNGFKENIEDVAYGCGKNFSLKYSCGNIPKTQEILGESWLQYGSIDCSKEFASCLAILIITDEGYIYICKFSDVTITNDNFAKLNDNAKIFYTWDFSDKIDKSNDSINYIRNFIFIGVYLAPEICICSPNKKLAITCDPSTIELVFLTYSESVVKVDDINNGLTNTTTLYEITNLPPANNVGKVAWVNAMGLRKEYTPDLLEKGDEYIMRPGWDSVGNDIHAENMSPEEGKRWCNKNDDCAGFEYVGGICYFKNKDMYPKGKRQAILGGQLYIRQPDIKSNGSNCSKKVNSIDNLTWDHYIPDIFNGIYMTENYNCSNNLLNPNMGDSTNLINNKDKLVNQLNNLDSSIFEDTTNLVNNTASLNKENNFLYNSMKENFENQNQLNDITYLNTLLSNSKKFVIQKSYIIITLLVILLGLIIVLYKIKK